jgi:hypothetical protein
MLADGRGTEVMDGLKQTKQQVLCVYEYTYWYGASTTADAIANLFRDSLIVIVRRGN